MLENKSTPSFSNLVKNDIELKFHSNWKIGGTADYFAEPINLAELKTILRIASNEGIPFKIIGNGTNILFDDRGYRGLIIKIGQNFNKIEVCGVTVVAEAGIWMPCFAKSMANLGLSGIEHTVGIPGNLGGIVFMNGGSLRKSLSDNISKVFALDYSGNELTIEKKKCNFSYRQSIFQTSPLIIYKVELVLNKTNINIIRADMLKILGNRRKKFPLKSPNCGSVFISHSMLYDSYGPPGRIIEELGLKGYVRGGAMISDLHANFILNRGDASSKDIIGLFKHIRYEIFKITNVWVKSEIRYLSPDAQIAFLHDL